MSFFGRTFIIIALFAGAVHVFRRDITKVVSVLKKPTENFIKEVKNELETTNKSTANTIGSIVGKDSVNNGIKEQQIAAQQAAESIKNTTTTSTKSTELK